MGMEERLLAILIFFSTYLGIAIGSIPGLAIDRTGIAILGATAMISFGLLTIEEALSFIHVPTLLLLYGLMVLSAQLKIGGFYTQMALKIVRTFKGPKRFLLLMMGVSALLSAVLANDIVCLAFTPVICLSMLKLKVNPIPFLLGLVMASNIGSASTIIGNPQNMLIGQVGKLPFGEFILWCGPPSVLSLFVSYLFLILFYRGKWYFEDQRGFELKEESFQYDPHHTKKGLILTALLLFGFFTPIPREVLAITVAGVLLCSRYITTREILSFVDWHLLALFVGLFIIIGGVSKFHIPQKAIADLKAFGLDLHDPKVLTLITLILSNILSNVPAVMLILHNLDLSLKEYLYLLALISTYAGNLITIGSIANLITIEQASRFNVKITFKGYAKCGLPITLSTVLIGFLWWSIFRGFLRG
jgi:Na+/H+ antiporter NhaD/arsenite permease-like protein